MTYEVYFICTVLPCYEVIYQGLTLEQAEEKVTHLNKMKKYDKSKSVCCNYYFQPEQ